MLFWSLIIEYIFIVYHHCYYYCSHFDSQESNLLDHRDDIESALEEINKSENLQTEISQENKILTRDIMEQKNTINADKNKDKNVKKN